MIHPEDVTPIPAGYWNPGDVGLAAEMEVRIVRADGEVRWLRSISNAITDAQGVVIRVASTVEDITDRNTAQAAVRAAHLDAARANTAKSEFLSRMSHELRTPLNAVLGFGQLLELESLSESQQQAVGHILRGGRHLLTLIDDVLDISRIETDRLDVSLEPVAIGALIADVVGLMQPTASAAGIELGHDRPQYGGVASIHVRADRRRLQQVLLNLVSNAIKYNRPGRRVDLSTNMLEEGRLEIRIADTGIGIRAEDIPRLFTPFERLGQEITDIEGVGIGLALTHRLVTVMQGELRVESVFGQGSTFSVLLPLLASPVSYFPANIDEAALETSTDVTTSESRLLYIDDNRSNLELITRIAIHRPNWTVTTAVEGGHGLDLARTMKPTLIMLDLHLPDMRGADVLRALQADPLTSRVPVIIVSADANTEQASRLQAAGALRYRTKPVNISEILHDLDEQAVPVTSSLS
jgi:signal transduction histidine kinase/CheY-like chemotaxis protein